MRLIGLLAVATVAAAVAVAFGLSRTPQSIPVQFLVWSGIGMAAIAVVAAFVMERRQNSARSE